MFIIKLLSYLISFNDEIGWILSMILSFQITSKQNLEIKEEKLKTKGSGIDQKPKNMVDPIMPFYIIKFHFSVSEKT